MQNKNDTIANDFSNSNIKNNTNQYVIRIYIKTNNNLFDESFELYEDKNGNFEFKRKLFQDALRFVDKIQSDLCHSSHASISKIENGKFIETIISRQDSIYRMSKKNNNPAMKKIGVGNLKNYMRAKGDIFYFSKG